MSQIKVILLAIILAPLHVMAEQIEVPNEFVDQTPAQASEVNQNFKAVADGVNAQDVRILAVEEESSSRDLRIQTVENAIAGPQEMVFLGYAEGARVVSNLYANNQTCKDAYGNSSAQMLTSEAWMKFINGGEMTLPSSGEIAAVRISDAILVSRGTGTSSDTVLLYIPSLDHFTTIAYNSCGINSAGLAVCYDNSQWTHIACMAPAAG